MERIRACPACGSVDLQWASGGAFAALDAMGGTGLGLVTCGECGRRVMPIEFESVKALGRFRVAKAEEKALGPRVPPSPRLRRARKKKR